MFLQNVNNSTLSSFKHRAQGFHASIGLKEADLKPVNIPVNNSDISGITVSDWVLGHSVEGRPIRVFDLLFDPLGILSSERTSALWNTLFIGSFHGDEGLSTQLLERFLAEWYNEEKPRQELIRLAPVRFAIVPALNPDGLAKNTRVNANGVDLNRNWPTQNWMPQPGPELGLGTAYFEGPAPASEPETLALQSLIEKYQPQKIVSIHTPYRVINYDGPALELAQAMSAKTVSPSGTGQEVPYPVLASIGYPTPGSFGTYYGVERSIPVITLELPEVTETGEPISLQQLWDENHGALLAALAYPTGSD